ncbi:unnamed protein product [Miscanthus lutarioriparius]|uniref:Uncharacterized protein n=1 Tax=Miscanthus lutarioriparius TaxID=422564 RepID=A0A811ND77_9POAL|nr:unnamed protein product [Miscanthus lutarioriparius]
MGLTSPSSRSWRKATRCRCWTSPASCATGGSPPSPSSQPRATPPSSAPRCGEAGQGPATTRPSSSSRTRPAGTRLRSGRPPAFAEATSALRPRFEKALAALRPPASLLVADGFLYWAHASVTALGVPSVSFLGTSAFAHVVREACVRDKPGAPASPQFDDATTATATTYYTVPEFPHLQFSLRDLVPPPLPMIDLDAKMAAAVAASRGLIINTFHDLEGRYIEHWNQHIRPKVWAIGPLWLARQSSSSSFSGTGSEQLHAKPSWMQWLDGMAAAGKPVLYISLGTLAAISRAGPDFFEARGETTIRGPLYMHDIDSTKCKYIYINT